MARNVANLRWKMLEQDGLKGYYRIVGDALKPVIDPLRRDGPVVVDAVVDPLILSMPSHDPLHTAGGYTLSLAKQVLNGGLDAVISQSNTAFVWYV
jgi:hypothetical protein